MCARVTVRAGRALLSSIVATFAVAACGPASRPPLRVHFYNSGQGLAALVTLPNGTKILIDAGESPTRVDCDSCAEWHERVMEGLDAEVGKGPLELLWITHQHSDHLGGAPAVLSAFRPSFYVDNGLDLSKGTVHFAREAALSAGVQIAAIDPSHAELPPFDTGEVTLTPIVPAAWPAGCRDDPNACSIGLRFDYAESSILFTGDGTNEEAAQLDPRGEVTLLQVGHHGSDTATDAPFLDRIRPKYAVISVGKPNEGTNSGYCHPRSDVIGRLTAAMGGAGRDAVGAFDGRARCDATAPAPEHWIEVPASDRLWVTARDGDVLLSTTGDGNFTRE